MAGRVLDALLPPGCPVCDVVVDSAGALCGECWREINFLGPPQCSACGLPFEYDDHGGLSEDVLCGACVRRPPPFERARAAMVYGDISRKIILAFKHADRTDTAPGLGRMLAQAGSDLIADADLIAPVPLHWTRLFQRRYNQAALLAGVVAHVTGKSAVQDLLVRKRKTKPQGRMGPAERRRNIQGAIKVNAAKRDRLSGKRVLLIDDVLTTGVTASESTKALLRGGAVAVDVLTLARVVRAAD